MANSTVIINTVARRLRDTANLAYPRAVLIRFVDHAQRIIVAHTKSVVLTASVNAANLHTFSPLYQIPNLTGQETSSVESIRQDGKTLNPIGQWQSIVHQDPNWFGTVGTRYVSWGTIGKDLLILYPIVTPVPTGIDLQIDYVPTVPSTPFDNNTNDMPIPDDLVPMLQDLVETLGCWKGRRFSEAADPIARFQQQLATVGREYTVQDVAGRV